MRTLAEIEAAVEALPREQKEELLLFLATLLRAERAGGPRPREVLRERIEGWVEEDDADMRRPGDTSEGSIL